MTPLGLLDQGKTAIQTPEHGLDRLAFDINQTVIIVLMQSSLSLLGLWELSF